MLCLPMQPERDLDSAGPFLTLTLGSLSTWDLSPACPPGPAYSRYFITFAKETI